MLNLSFSNVKVHTAQRYIVNSEIFDRPSTNLVNQNDALSRMANKYGNLLRGGNLQFAFLFLSMITLARRVTPVVRSTRTGICYAGFCLFLFTGLCQFFLSAPRYAIFARFARECEPRRQYYVKY